MSYILLREAYIANTRNESVTLGDSYKLWLARLHDSLIALYVNLNEAVAHLLQREGLVMLNYRVVAEECNYRPLWLGNKMLASAKHVTYFTP